MAHRLRSVSLLLRAGACLAIARLAVVLLPFAVLSRRLGDRATESPERHGPAQRATARRVAWAVRTASRRAPFRSRCLEQSIAAKLLLRSRRIPNTLYVGVARAGEGGLESHAWLRSGSLYLTGGEERRRYTVVSSFADVGRGPRSAPERFRRSPLA